MSFQSLSTGCKPDHSGHFVRCFGMNYRQLFTDAAYVVFDSACVCMYCVWVCLHAILCSRTEKSPFLFCQHEELSRMSSFTQQSTLAVDVASFVYVNRYGFCLACGRVVLVVL